MAVYRPALHAIVALCMVAGAPGSHAQPAPDVRADSLARLPYLQRRALDRETQKTFAAFIGEGAEGVLRGPLAFAAYTPGVAQALFDLHNAAVAGTLSTRVRELAILVACRETNYDGGWNPHEPAAVRAGVDPALIDIVRNRGSLAGVPEPDAAVIRFGRQLLTEKNVDAATFAKIVELLGERGAMDMVAVMSTYAVSGFYEIAVDQQQPAGRPALPR